ncbi:hypothetical protein CASFOL_027544 [Castilleja foliolosa]|uniref:acid phosphatase n=1 Tax=Castilleja foliolosa TaxID=1961234 RepID=A0ABD3CF44_9LAMI
MGKQSKGHAIMISFPYRGHINPYTSLALKLASKGFTITFVHLEFIHHKLSIAHHNGEVEDFFSEARESGLDIRYTTISDGFPLEFDRDSQVQEYWEVMLHDFPSRYFLVTDTVYPWAATIADKYKIVNVSFWTEPALVFSLAYHWNLLKEKGHFPCKAKTDQNITYVPGVKSINTRDLMSFLKEDELDVVYKMLFQAFEEVKKADFILHSTVEELESDIISILNTYQPNYAVGPINFAENLASNTVSKSLWSGSDCTSWLESKSPDSVLYVSFGSCVHISRQTIEEMAYGLLLSEVDFIWVVREVPWCNQITVLSNRAVGGFLTHNGWNSTVESMWYGWSMIGILGLNLCEGERVERIKVAEKIKSCMFGDSVSKSLKVDASRVKGVMRKALEPDGSSGRNFDRFVKDLEAKIHAETANVGKLSCPCLCDVNVMARLVGIRQGTRVESQVSFLAVGDWGRKGLFNQSAVAQQMGQVGAKLGIDFVISTGDNFYNDGLTGVNDSAFTESFTKIYTARSLRRPWYAILGNHDYHGNTEAQLNPLLKKQDRRWNCHRSYVVRSGIVHIFFIDTNPFVQQYFGKANFNWKGVLPRDRYVSNLLRDLRTNLKRSNATWKIVVGHHPIKSAGKQGDTRELVQQLLPILQANKVPIYINGHEHCLEHINNTGSPIEFLTSGGGSRAWGNISHRERYKNNLRFYYDGQGFISVQLTRLQATVAFYDVFGKILHSFKLKK